MMNFIRDSAWQFVGVIITIAGIYLSIIIYQKQKERKELIYDILHEIPISSFKISDKTKVSIIFYGKHLSDVTLIYLKLYNNGNKEITPDDFIEPIIFDFGTSVKVLETVVEATGPDDLKDKVNIEHNSHKIIMNPTLINKGDHIILKILLDKFNGSIRANTRIKGLKQIKNITETNLASSGYLKSIGVGAKEIFFNSNVRWLVTAKLLGMLLGIILIIIFGSSKTLNTILGYIMIYSSPIALWTIITLCAFVGLNKLKVRYNLWVVLTISAMMPIALLAFIIYAIMAPHH